jgi:hypothetical protein
MRYLLLAVLLFIETKTRYGQDPKPAAYTTIIHVHASHLYNECVSNNICSYAQRLDVLIDGKKYELERFQASNVLRVGDYKAALVEDKHPRTEEYSQAYEILFSDGKTGKFDVVGESE